MQKNPLIGKLLYGTLFMAVVPALLVFWAQATALFVHLPVPENPVFNYLALSVGVFFVAFGMIHLWVYGRGLPMNAFPPKYFVKRGVYAIARNPIYLGSAITCFGLSAVFQSASGFWLVSPLFALMIIAYTVGFENERTAHVFGPQDYRPFLSLPEKSDQHPTLHDRVAVYFLTLLPWFLVYKALAFAGHAETAVFGDLSFEKQWPVIGIAASFYVLAYLFTGILPFVINTKRMVRALEIDVWLAVGISAIVGLVFPFAVEQRSFVAETFWGDVLMYFRDINGTTLPFPPFPVVSSLLAARYFTLTFRKFRWLWYGLAVLICLSCIGTGLHSFPEVVAGVGIFITVYFRRQIWDAARRASEHIANSWKEWEIGPVRIINHGFYAGAAGFVGVFLVGSFLGGQYAVAGFVTGIFGIAGAALWAQLIEGSPRLQRPYGYYGSLAGVIIGSVLIVNVFALSVFSLLAAFSMAAPWIQVLGRLRCLVQGCCHGKPAGEWLGIHFTHACSRVNKISGLRGAPLHPTQLYSIGANVLTGLVLIRLFMADMPATFIIGMYLMLNGLGRFVEEYFRGEAQTPYWSGMRIYQWIAIMNIILGAVFTGIPSGALSIFQLTVESLYWAVAMGLFATVAYGVDFPHSNRRFARLTSE